MSRREEHPACRKNDKAVSLFGQSGMHASSQVRPCYDGEVSAALSPDHIGGREAATEGIWPI